MMAHQAPEQMDLDKSLADRFFSLPSTRLGKWSMWLAVLFIALFVVNSFVFIPLSDSTSPTVNSIRETVLPFYGIALLLCGAATGVIALVSLLQERERSWVVWSAVLPLGFVLFLLLGEFLGPSH